MEQLVFKEECFKIVGLCIEVHKLLGKGFSENVYKDAYVCLSGLYPDRDNEVISLYF